MRRFPTRICAFLYLEYLHIWGISGDMAEYMGNIWNEYLEYLGTEYLDI